MTNPKEVSAILLLILAAVVVGFKEERERLWAWYVDQSIQTRIEIGVLLLAFFTIAIAFPLRGLVVEYLF